MRVVLSITAIVLALLIGFQFIDEPAPKRPFEDLTVALIFPEDDEGDIRDLMANAWQAVEVDFGCRVEPVFTAWSSEGIAQAVRQMASARPAGICIMGYPANELLLPELDEALDLDIPITTYTSRFPPGEDRASTNGFGFVGINQYQAGYDVANAAIRKHDLQPGNRALIVGDLDHIARRDFRDGCITAFEEGGLEISRYQISIRDLVSNPKRFVAFLSTLAENDQLPQVLCTTEFPIRITASRMNDAGLSQGSVPLIGLGIDTRPDRDRLARAERDRHTSLLASQELSVHAYLAILQACMTNNFSAPGMRIELPHEIIGSTSERTQSLKSNSARFVQLN